MFFFAYSLFYVARRSFWIDEAMAALAIVNSGLSPFKPLAVYNQVSPWGFVLITRLMQALFGAGDLQFRLPGLVFYFAGMAALGRYLKRYFGLAAAAGILVAMLANPLLLRYSTEFKHYIYEFTFAIFLLVNYLRVKTGEPRAMQAYSVSLMLSIFFGISTLFVVASIFTIETFMRLRSSIRDYFKSGWLFLHAAYGVVFVMWYFLSITPNLRNNLINYPHIYGVDLGWANLTSMSHWAKVLQNAIFSLFVPQSVFLLVCLAGLLLFNLRVLRARDWAVLGAPVLVYLYIYAANFMGVYPILTDRHLLFTLPMFYILFALALSKTSSLFSSKILRAAPAFLLTGMSLVSLVIAHRGNQFFFQEIKPVLAEVAPDDDLFIYFSAQPGYEWYRYSLFPDLPDALNPPVNTDSGPRFSQEEMAENLPARIRETGAWPAIAYLTQTDQAFLYEEYIGDMVIRARHSLLLISHRSGKFLRNYLEDEACLVKRVFGLRGASIYTVDCW